MALRPLSRLAPSGENAIYLDDDQFDAGSLMKCGPEIVALFWHSVAVGRRNPYSAADIHRMAHLDYERFIGPDVRADGWGTSDQVFYRMIRAHRFAYLILPRNWQLIRQYVAAGYPVALGGVNEKTVLDLEIGECPYRWERPRGAPTYWHIILATGLDGQDALKCRDTANIDDAGRLRPGPRRYSTRAMAYTTATALVPTWLPVPLCSVCKGQRFAGTLH